MLKVTQPLTVISATLPAQATPREVGVAQTGAGTSFSVQPGRLSHWSFLALLTEGPPTEGPTYPVPHSSNPGAPESCPC